MERHFGKSYTKPNFGTYTSIDTDPSMSLKALLCHRGDNSMIVRVVGKYWEFEVVLSLGGQLGKFTYTT